MAASVETFVAETVEAVRPIDKAYQLAEWEAAVSGTPEANQRNQDAQAAWMRFWTDRPRYLQAKQLHDARAAGDPLLASQLKLVYLTAARNQQDDATIDELTRLEADVRGKYLNFRGRVGGKELNDNELEAMLHKSQSSAEVQEAWEASKQQLNGFILPESMAISANLNLDEAGKTPMRIFYLEDAVGVQDFPLGWVSGISEEKQAQFAQLIEYLRSDEVHAKIQSEGYFRTGILGMEVPNPDMSVFNPDWGIITNKSFVPATLPKDDVIKAALNLYQLAIKKPSETAFCLDYSPSMYGSGEQKRNAAMQLLLDQSSASTYLLQTGPADVTYVLPFSNRVLDTAMVDGNDPQQLLALNDWLLGSFAGSGTNIYGCAIEALQLFLELSSSINSTLDIKQILHILTAEICRALGMKGALIRLINEETGTLDLIATYGLSAEFLDKGPVSAEKSIAETLKGKTVVVEDVAAFEQIQYRQEHLKEGVVSMLSVPNKSKQKVIGRDAVVQRGSGTTPRIC